MTVETDVTSDDAEAIWGVQADDRMTPEAVFVEEYVRSGNAFLACSKAGFRDPRYPMDVTAQRTLERPEIQAAIRAYRKAGFGKQRRVGEYTREVMLHELQMVHEKALEAGAYGPAITAVNTQAKLLGFMDQTVNVNVRMTAQELPLDELRRLVAQGRERVGVVDAEYEVLEDMRDADS